MSAINHEQDRPDKTSSSGHTDTSRQENHRVMGHVGDGPVRTIGLIVWTLRYDFLVMLGVATGVAVLSDLIPMQSIGAIVPLLGVVVSIFIGFRNTYAYNRWWEARTLWGTLSANGNALRNALTAVGDRSPEMVAVTDEMLRRQVRHAWQLAAELRAVNPLPGVAQLTPEDPPNASATSLLARQAESVRRLMLGGHIDGQGRSLLTNLNTAQSAVAAGLERIRTQPLPTPYVTFIRALAWLFGSLVCLRLGTGEHDRLVGFAVGVLIMALFIVAERLGYFLEHPMSNTPFDLPLYRFCAAITAELLGPQHPLAQPRQAKTATSLGELPGTAVPDR